MHGLGVNKGDIITGSVSTFIKFGACSAARFLSVSKCGIFHKARPSRP